MKKNICEGEEWTVISHQIVMLAQKFGDSF